MTVDAAYSANVRPSSRQLAWQRLEFYGFIHFGINTMTDREWGDGTEDPAMFDPEDLDVDEWALACRSAGMTAVILTCKHHDGFALWPTGLSGHSVASSPWRDGRGDLVREVSDACARHGLRFGVYLSPWDRAEPSYGSGTAYDDFYVSQLTELLTSYGDIFCVWLDGANGEGPNGRRQLYDWDRYYRVIRSLQPEAVISVCGPDVRWCGNEAGQTRADEWSVVPWQLRDAERTSDRSQQADDAGFSRLVRSDEDDLGSRAALASYTGEPVWYPAEVNTSIRPGWFHHPAEDDLVRSAEELFEIWKRSVGGNSTFLLNVPPRRDGRLSSQDLSSLAGLGDRIRAWEASDRAPDARITRVGDAEVRLDWDAPVLLSAVAIEEDIRHGQRIESVEVRIDEAGDLIAAAASVGYRRIVDFTARPTRRLIVTVTGSRGRPMVSRVRALSPAPDRSA